MSTWKKVITDGAALTELITPVSGDKVLVQDASDSDVIKYVDFGDIGGSSGGVTINDNVNNYLVTASGSANTLNGESNLTYSTDLSITSGNILIATNNRSIEGKLTSGASRPLIGINTSDQVVVGNTSAVGTKLVGGSIQDSTGVSSAGDYGDGADITFIGSSATSVTQGSLYYYSGTTWTSYTTTTEAPQKALVGMAIGTTMAAGFVLRGIVYGGTSLTGGGLVFGKFDGSFTDVAASTGFQRVMGHGISTSLCYFNPSQDYLELT